MRIIAIIAAVLFAGVAPGVAQEQEGKLMDRLLRPNLALKNSAQDKKFTNATVASFDKPAATRAFYAPDKNVARSYQDDRTFTPRQFAARHFRAGDSTANVTARSELRKNDAMIPVAPVPGVRVAAESAQVTPTHDYAGSKPFTGQGKSQKSLSAQHPPLTIEQVRELLNKSK